MLSNQGAVAESSEHNQKWWTQHSLKLCVKTCVNTQNFFFILKSLLCAKVSYSSVWDYYFVLKVFSLIPGLHLFIRVEPRSQWQVPVAGPPPQRLGWRLKSDQLQTRSGHRQLLSLSPLHSFWVVLLQVSWRSRWSALETKGDLSIEVAINKWPAVGGALRSAVLIDGEFM